MPFTVSHVAAVLPVHRPLSRLRIFSAAVIGSMVPDFGLLLPGGLARWQTHSLQALFSFCLPVGLLTCLLTHILIKPAFVEILPDGAYARLRAAPPEPSWRQARTWLRVIAALLFGALTHLVWDGFTHENARGVRLFPQLLHYGPDMAGHDLRLYAWLQYGSSVVGLAVVAAALALWLHHAPAPHPRPSRRLSAAERWLWGLLYTVPPVLAVLLLRLLPMLRGHAPVLTGSGLGSLAIAGMRAAAVSLLAISALLLMRLAAQGIDSRR